MFSLRKFEGYKTFRIKNTWIWRKSSPRQIHENVIKVSKILNPNDDTLILNHIRVFYKKCTQNHSIGDLRV